MRIYIHEKGIARFATETYCPPKPSNIDNMFINMLWYVCLCQVIGFKSNVVMRYVLKEINWKVCVPYATVVVVVVGV